ncbi:MAG: 3-oxoacyl-[acyl-carrier-protein] synthase III C-terminal domain-containing protein [Candidatus Woesearchaeota archaeon]
MTYIFPSRVISQYCETGAITDKNVARKSADALEAAASNCGGLSSIDQIIFAIDTNSSLASVIHPFPSVAAQAVHLAGAGHIAAFDTRGPNGRADAEIMANAYLGSGSCQRVAVIYAAQDGVKARVLEHNSQNVQRRLYSSIVSTGAYLPDAILGNVQVAKDIEREKGKEELTPQGISQRSGADERRVARLEETLDFNGRMALTYALRNGGKNYSDLDYLIVTSSHPDAHTVAAEALTKPRRLLVYLGCAGSCKVMEVANVLIGAGAKIVGIVATERLRDITDKKDKDTSMLFGDGAAAMIMEASDKPGVLASKSVTYGELANLITLEPKGEKLYIKMDGRAVFNFAKDQVPEPLKEFMRKNNISPDMIKAAPSHQASNHILSSQAKALGLEGKVMSIMKWCANISSASALLAFHIGIKYGLVKPGDLVLAYAFGAGLAATANLIWLDDHLAVPKAPGDYLDHINSIPEVPYTFDLISGAKETNMLRKAAQQ